MHKTDKNTSLVMPHAALSMYLIITEAYTATEEIHAVRL